MITPPVCPYCQASAELISSESAHSSVLWNCPTEGCDSSVGVTEGQLPWPNGTMANAALRKMRQRLFAIYTSRMNRLGSRHKQRLPLLGERNRVKFLREDACQKLLMDLVSVATESRHE